MKIPGAIATLFLAIGLALANEVPKSYADATLIWERTHTSIAYQKYAEEFSQFNNRFHLDEKGGCYNVAPERVNLMLVISHQEKHRFGTINQVFAEVDTAKARCFEKIYRGLRTKIPPFVPFVLQLSMG